MQHGMRDVATFRRVPLAGAQLSAAEPMWTACLTCPAKCVTANVVPFFFAFVNSFSYLLGFRLAPAGLRPRALPKRTKRARTRSYAVQRSAEADPSGRDKAFDRQRRMRAAQLIPAQMWAGAGLVPAQMWAG